MAETEPVPPDARTNTSASAAYKDSFRRRAIGLFLSTKPKGCRMIVEDHDISADRHFRKSNRLTFDKPEQVGIDDVGLRRDHAMREVLICFQRAVLKELG